MRLASLDLIAFGRFSDQQLAFDCSKRDFHLVYGANEAGKTTAIEALRALLYGIDARTPYAFRHPYPELRVGAELVLDGKPQYVVRRKGTKNTLQDASGTPLGDTFLQRLLATMERDQFQRMFALTHDDLVSGGEEIVAGQGDAGQALFAAGLGGVHLNSLLRHTQERADELFRPRSPTKPLNRKLGQLRDLDADIRRLQLSGEQWAKQVQEAAQARKRLQELVERCEALAQEQLRLQRLQRTLPLLGKMQQLATALTETGEVVSLPDDFDERRRGSLGQLDEARRALESLEEKLARARAQAGDVQVPAECLQRAAEIEQLAERLGSHQKGQKDSVKLQADHQARLSRMSELLMELPGKPDLPTALRSMPDAATLAAVDALSPQKQALDEKLRIATQELQECRDGLARATQALEQLPPDTDTANLQRVLRNVQRQGDLAGELAKQAKALAKDEATATQALSKLGLWQGEPDVVATMPVPLEETVAGFAANFRASDEERARQTERQAQLHSQAAALRQELQELDASGVVPAETDLTAVRHERDEGWQLIKRHYVLGEEDDLAAYAPDGDAAAIYEGQVAEADQVADTLRSESQKVLQHARLENGLQQADADLEAIAEQLAQQDRDREALLTEWRDAWTEVGIDPLSPDEMREWLRRLEDLRAACGRVTERRLERDAAQAALRAASSALAAELAKLGTEDVADDEPLIALVERAQTLLDEEQTNRQARAQLTRDGEEGRRNEERRQQDVAKAGLALQEWTDKWSGTTRALGVGEQPTVEQVTAVLRVFRDLDEAHKEAMGLERRLKGIERDTTSFQEDVQRLVNELAPELATLAPVGAARQLQSRLAAARQAQTLADRLAAEIAEREAEITEAEETRRLAQSELQALAELAQCEVGQLQQLWERHLTHRSLEDQLRLTEEQLANAGDDKSTAELQKEAVGHDADSVRVRLESLADELAQATEQREAQRESAWELERTVAAHDASAEAAAKADERQALLAQMRDEVEQYLTLVVAKQLLVQSIEMYRTSNQGPLLQRASDLFARMTCGAFGGLSLEYGDADDPVLVGVRKDGDGTVGVAGMSDGTCDQLYLALRLAAIEQFCQQSEPLPLIVDDILIRFDDHRARETLSVLGEVSQGNQVIFFTHHWRLKELADEVLGKDGYGFTDLSA